MTEPAQEWRRRWDEISSRALEAKDSSSAIPKLFAAYSTVPESQRPVVDAVLAEAVESDDELDRFDALALVREFRITSAVPSLQRLASRLKETQSPEGRHLRKQVNAILSELGN